MIPLIHECGARYAGRKCLAPDIAAYVKGGRGYIWHEPSKDAAYQHPLPISEIQTLSGYVVHYAHYVPVHPCGGWGLFSSLTTCTPSQWSKVIALGSAHVVQTDTRSGSSNKASAGLVRQGTR